MINTRFKEIQNSSFLTAQVACLMLICLIPLSTSLASVVSGVVFLTAILSLNKERLKQGFGQPVTLWILALLGIYLLSCSYSSANTMDILKSMKKISRLLLIPLLMPLFREEIWKKRAIIAFCVTMTFVLLVILFKTISLNKELSSFTQLIFVFKDYIFLSLFFAFLSFIFINYSVEYINYRIWFILASTISTCYVMLFCSGRSGQLLLVLLYILFLVRNRKSLLLILAPCLIIILSLFHGSFGNRMNLTFDHVKEHIQIKNNEPTYQPSNTSMGIRLELAQNTLSLINMKPWLGWGAGSFKKEYYQYLLENFSIHDDKANPHNQYLLVLFETGILGFTVFVILLGYLFSLTIKQNDLYSRLSNGLVLMIIAGNFANSWLLDFTSMHFFSVFLGILLPAYQNQGRIYVFFSKAISFFNKALRDATTNGTLKKNMTLVK